MRLLWLAARGLSLQVVFERIAEGEGFLSRIVRCTISFANVQLPPFRCVLKIPVVHNFGVEATEEDEKKVSSQTCCSAVPT